MNNILFLPIWPIAKKGVIGVCMKKLGLLLLVIVTTLVFTGCDFFLMGLRLQEGVYGTYRQDTEEYVITETTFTINTLNDTKDTILSSEKLAITGLSVDTTKEGAGGIYGYRVEITTSKGVEDFIGEYNESETVCERLYPIAGSFVDLADCFYRYDD